MEMESLLKEWGLGTFIPVFEEHGVTLEALSAIFEAKDNESIRNLIPQVGYQAVLRKKFQEYLDIQASSFRTDEGEGIPEGTSESELGAVQAESGSGNELPTLQCEDIYLLSNTGELQHVQTCETDIQSSPSTHSFQSTPSCSGSGTSLKRKFANNCLQDLEIKNILEQNCYGEAVIKIYEKNKYLTPRYQRYLVDVLITHLISHRKEYGYLTNESWDILSDKIIQLFPLEEKSSYYIPPVKKSNSKTNKSGISRGKLPDKYKNELALLRESGVLPRMESKAETDTCDELSDLDEQSDTTIVSKEWLEHYSEPLDDVLQHWLRTRSFRRAQLAGNTFKTVSSILDEWPILKHNFGYILIEKDFEAANPEKATLLFTEFSKLFKSALELKKKSVENTDNQFLVDLLDTDISPDSRTLIQIHLLCSLICNRSPKLKKWKPSIAECREGVFLQVKTPDQIEPAIKAKRDKVKKYGLTLQPFVIVEAPSITKVLSSYVFMDGVLYKTKSLMHAIDVCFKAFIVFNATYPPECEHIWYLLQIAVYDLPTKFDNKIPYILDFIKLLKRA